MASNEFGRRFGPAALCLTLVCGGCSVLTPRESPLNEVSKDAPTALEVYRGTVPASSDTRSARERLQSSSLTQPVSVSDARQSPYWSPLEPMRERFARVPNPDLVMVVYPHLAKGRYPVPGYVTTFPMYEEVHYALPGELEGELQAARARFTPPVLPAQPGPSDTGSKPSVPRKMTP